MVHDVSHGVQIEAFIYSRLKGREICQRALLAPPASSMSLLLRALRSASFETSQDGLNISEHISNALPQSKEFCVLFALYGLVSYLGSLTLTSSGRYKIRWLNIILKVVAAILAAWLAKFPVCSICASLPLAKATRRLTFWKRKDAEETANAPV